MRISDRYIGKQVLAGTFYAILFLTLLLVLGNLFKEARSLLVEYGAPLAVLGEFALNVLPVSLIYTIPWAFLTAVLLVFGRLSSDHELTAFRGAGISLQRIALPVFLLGALLSALCLWLNLHVAPQAKEKLNIKYIVINTLIQDPKTLLKAAAAQSRDGDLKVDYETTRGEWFENLHIFHRASGRPGSGVHIHADRAEPVVDSTKRQIRLRLEGAFIDGSYQDGRQFTLMAEELQWMLFDYSGLGGVTEKPGAMRNEEIDAYLAAHPFLLPEARADWLAHKTRRYTSSMACLAFALVGVPLGIKARRRDTSGGLVLSIAIGVGYFLASSMLGNTPGRQWMLWLPNLACLLLGIVLFRRARIR